jgi:general secretion pathway protein F
LLQQQAAAAAVDQAAAGAVTRRRVPGRGNKRSRCSCSAPNCWRLLEAGLSLVEAFEALLEKSSPTARAVLERLTTRPARGFAFFGRAGRQPDVFPPLYVGIVRAAEGTSDLPRALARYLDYQTRLETVRSKMISAASTRPSCSSSALRDPVS